MHIMFIISSLRGGGAEHVMANMANYWAAKGVRISLLTLDTTKTDFYPLNERVERQGLGLVRDSRNIFSAVYNSTKRIIGIRRAIRDRRPHIVISFVDCTNVLTLAATVALRLPVIVAEHIDPRYHHIGKTWAFLRKILYKRANKVVVLTESVRRWALHFLPASRVSVIPNSLTCGHPRSRGQEGLSFPNPFVIAVGRLVRQKGFDYLLPAFAECRKHHTDWSLMIVGDGEDRKKLESLSKKLGISSSVSFIGSVPDPLPFVRSADIFVLSSRYEGFPLVLLEAMSCGTPVVSFDCPSGPSDLIRHEDNGLLVTSESVSALSYAMGDLMSHPDKRAILGERGKGAVAGYGEDRIMRLWEDLIGDCES